jgi:hypothetical protein
VPNLEHLGIKKPRSFQPLQWACLDGSRVVSTPGGAITHDIEYQTNLLSFRAFSSSVINISSVPFVIDYQFYNFG